MVPSGHWRASRRTRPGPPLNTVGRRVTVATATGGVTGMAVGVTPEGALLVRDDNAAEHVIWSGDVTALRALSRGRTSWDFNLSVL